jgi:hypothetical protein
VSVINVVVVVILSLTNHYLAANWGIVLAGLMDVNRDPEKISGTMTTAMCVYSALFMRFALKVKPQNLLLFACHACNESVQLYTLGRLVNYEMNKKKQVEQQ